MGEEERGEDGIGSTTNLSPPLLDTVTDCSDNS